MKKSISIISSALCVLLLASCSKDFRSGSLFGSEVNFSGTITGALLTKAHYGDRDGGFDKIHFDVDDTISIYCEAVSEPSFKQGKYEIKSVSTSSAQLVKKEMTAVGLRWGTGEHTFYAVCPAFGNEVTQSINANIIKGKLPYVQSGKSVETNSGNAVIIPDFGNQMLYAKAGPFTEEGGLPEGVFLEFNPLCTAIEFTFQNGRTNAIGSIESFELVSENTQITGEFSVDIDDLTTAGDGYPKVTPNPDGKALTIEDKSVKVDRTMTMTVGSTITFTVFLLPGQDINDLKFVVHFTEEAGGGKLSTRLGYTDGTGVVIQRCKKTIIQGIILPEGVQWAIDYAPFLSEWEKGSEGTIDLN